jgi:nucleotide-binding universal stress UspA family protein
MKKVLVAVDFSDGAARAVRTGLDVAAKFGARLHILHVLHDPSEAPGFYSAKKAGKKVWRNMEQSAQDMMDAFVKANVKTRRKFDVEIVSGLPPAQILRVATREDVDLIVLGTHGRSGWERLLLGSVADHVVRRATCPVLTIPESPADRKERKQREKEEKKEEKKKETMSQAEEDGVEDGDQAAAEEQGPAEATEGDQEATKAS